MNTIKIYLTTNGSVADMHKDFPLYQSQYQNKLLNIYVPTSILSPEFRTLSAQGQTTSEYVAGTAVKIGMTYTARNGSIKESPSRYMRYLKTLTSNNVEYALFERKLPKEFTLYAGQGANAPTLIINVVNVLTTPIVNGTIAKGAGLSNLTINDTTFKTEITSSGTYNFIYSNAESSWLLGVNAVSLATYGIAVDGVVADGDIISVVYTSAPTVLSIITSQTCSLDVMQSTNLDVDEPVEATEIDTINARLNAIDLTMVEKQDKYDVRLQTTDKTVVGAINENKGRIDTNEANIAQNTEDITQNAEDIADIKAIIGTGEEYVGTLTVSTLPTDQQLNDFVLQETGRAVKGNDVVIVVLELAGQTDKNYKYIYNGTIWGSYEIPPFENASNGTKGILQGTYSIGSANNTLVDIIGGEILNIYVKDNNNVYRNIREYLNTTTTNIDNIISGDTTVGLAVRAVADSLGNNIVNTYLTQSAGATKEFVRDYALPREFNDTSYITSAGYVDEVPTTITPQFTVATSAVGDYTLFDISKTNTVEYELSKKNSADTSVYVSTNRDCVAGFRLTTYAKNAGLDWTLLSVELSNIISLNANEIQRIDFGSMFSSLGNTVLNLALNSQIRQQLEVITQESTPTTFDMYCNDVYPSIFNLNTQSQVIYHTLGMLGEEPVYTLTPLTPIANNEISISGGADVQIYNNVECQVIINIPVGTVGYENFSNDVEITSYLGGQEIRFATPYNFESGKATFGDLRQVVHTQNAVDGITYNFKAFIKIDTGNNITFIVDEDDLVDFADKDYADNNIAKIIQVDTSTTVDTTNKYIDIDLASSIADFEYDHNKKYFSPINIGITTLTGELPNDYTFRFHYKGRILNLNSVMNPSTNSSITVGQACPLMQPYNEVTGYRFNFEYIYKSGDGYEVLYITNLQNNINPSMSGEDLYNAIVDNRLKPFSTVLCTSNYTNNGTTYITGHNYKITATWSDEILIIGTEDITPTTKEEVFAIDTTDWTELTDSTPYTYQTSVTVAQTLGENTRVGTVNNQPVLFGNYGFVVGEIVGQQITIYSIGTPTSSVNITIGIRE